MKALLVFFVSLLLSGYSNFAKAQKPIYPKPNGSGQISNRQIIPTQPFNGTNAIMGNAYGKKNVNLPFTTFDTVQKKFITTTPGQSNLQSLQSPTSGNTRAIQTGSNAKPGPSSGFHLTKDINTGTVGSNPYNYLPNTPNSFAVLNNVSYFSADDGVHGRELWRSDGTLAGTYLVKDINAGESGSDVSGIIAGSGLIYFSAYSPINGYAPWVSDGTESGTHLLKGVGMGLDYSSPNQFVNVNGTVYFIASVYYYNSQLWKTDGTESGTVLVKDILQAGIGYSILELTAVNDMVYFIAYTWNTGYQLFRSDGTDAGTYVVKDIGYNYGDYSTPMQLTAYNNKLYFSVNDGSGRKLWESDGTYDGTNYAAGFNEVFMQQDNLNIYSNKPFSILNNVLYLAGYTYVDGSGLYKYDASNADGVVLVKNVASGFGTGFAAPDEMCVVNDAIFFKVIKFNGGNHDELWITNGETANTNVVKSFDPGDYTYSYYNGGGTFYFIAHTNAYGTELWKSNGTGAGTFPVKDIVPGADNSYPYDLTFCNGKLLFNTSDKDHGNELWESDGTATGTALVKDINTNGEGSNAGFWYKGISSYGGGVLFNAYTPDLGFQLYKSDGTTPGTGVLNNIGTSPTWTFFPNNFLFKNNVNYFIGDNSVGTALYKSDATTAGLKRIIANIDRSIYYVVSYNITDNGQAFYVLRNRFTLAYELWHGDGTESSGAMLFRNIKSNDYVVTIGNTAFFVGGDDVHGYELWKSDGTVLGTRLVRDINVGYNSSSPYSLFAYKNNLYFGAYDGFGLNYSLWKSDGTEKGTVKLKNITPATTIYEDDFGNLLDPVIQAFCISNSTLYFTATDFQTYGAELWKTNGTESGTKLVKDINTTYPYNANPANLTDVNGKLYFTADDGVHGNELWSTTGTLQSTKLVKDITPDYGSSALTNLCNAGGKLYFINRGTFPNTLWSSDGTGSGTSQVDDPVVNGLTDFSHLTAAGNKLFFGGFSRQYGAELYEGDVSAKTLSATLVSAAKVLEEKTNTNLDAALYPNPSHQNSTLTISGSAKNVSVTITDISGKTIWNKVCNDQHTINMPVAKMTAGVYLVTVRNNQEIKTLKFVKE